MEIETIEMIKEMKEKYDFIKRIVSLKKWSKTKIKAIGPVNHEYNDKEKKIAEDNKKKESLELGFLLISENAPVIDMCDPCENPEDPKGKIDTYAFYLSFSREDILAIKKVFNDYLNDNEKVVTVDFKKEKK